MTVSGNNKRRHQHISSAGYPTAIQLWSVQQRTRTACDPYRRGSAEQPPALTPIAMVRLPAFKIRTHAAAGVSFRRHAGTKRCYSQHPSHATRHPALSNTRRDCPRSFWCRCPHTPARARALRPPRRCWCCRGRCLWRGRGPTARRPCAHASSARFRAEGFVHMQID